MEVYLYSVLSWSPFQVLRVHISSLSLATWPAYCHSNSAILSIISLTLVLLRISKLHTLYLIVSVMPSNALFIARFITRNLFARDCVIAIVSILNVSTGRTQPLKTWRSRFMEIDLSICKQAYNILPSKFHSLWFAWICFKFIFTWSKIDQKATEINVTTEFKIGQFKNDFLRWKDQNNKNIASFRSICSALILIEYWDEVFNNCRVWIEKYPYYKITNEYSLFSLHIA